MIALWVDAKKPIYTVKIRDCGGAYSAVIRKLESGQATLHHSIS